MLYPLTLNLPLTEKLFELLHFQINIIYYLFIYFSRGDCRPIPTMSEITGCYYPCGDTM